MFLFHLKSSFHSQDIGNEKELELFMISSIDLHKFADKIFGITQ